MASERLPRPAWGHRTSLFQWRQPAFYLYAIIILLTGAVAVLEQAAYSEISAEGWVLSWVLLAFYAVPVFLLIYFLDLYEREPLSLVFGALVWGAVAATTLSALANTGWGLVVLEIGGPGFAAEWGAALTAPWTEEILKAAGVVLIYLIARREMDDILDGFVYGAMIGLGFTLVEDVFYFMGVFGGSTEGILFGFFLRVVASGLYGHVLYTGLAGMGIAYFTSRRAHAPFGRRLLVALGLFAAAVTGHFLWNSPLLDLFPSEPFEGADFLMIPVATAVKGLPLLAFVVMMVVLAHRREHRWLEAALAGEVGRAGVSHEDWEALRTTRTRRRARRAMRARAGPHAAMVLKRLQRQQVNLAMLRTRVGEEHPDVVRQREYCRILREALMGIQGARPSETAP